MVKFYRNAVIACTALLAASMLCVVFADDRNDSLRGEVQPGARSEMERPPSNSGYSWGSRAATRDSYGLAESIRDMPSRHAYRNLKDQIYDELPQNAFVSTGAAFSPIPLGRVRAFVRVKFSGEELSNSTSHNHDPTDEAYIDGLPDRNNGNRRDNDDDDDDDDDDDFFGSGSFRRRHRRNRRNRRRGNDLPAPKMCDMCIFKGLKDRMVGAIDELKRFGAGLSTRPNTTSFNNSIRFTRRLKIKQENEVLVGRGAISFSGEISNVMEALEKICVNKYIYIMGLIMIPDTEALSDDLFERLRSNAKALADSNAKDLFKMFGYTKELNSTDVEGGPIFKISVTAAPTVVTRDWFYGLNGLKAPEANSSTNRIGILNMNMLIQSRYRGLFTPVNK